MSPSDLVPDFVTKTADSIHDQLRFGVDADEIAFDASPRRIGVTFPGDVGADVLDKAKAVLGEVTGSPVRIR